MCVELPFWPQEGSIFKAISHLLITVSDYGQIEELAPMLFGQDRVNSCSVWASQLLIYCQIIRWWHKRYLAHVKLEGHCV